MEASKKFRLKRRYKTLMWVGYACILLFFVILITTIIIRMHSNANWSAIPAIAIILMIAWLLPLFSGMFCMMLSGISQRELQQYKYNIQVYRARNFAYKTIEHLQHGELQQAIDEYTKCNWYPEKSLDDYIYGMLIQACYLSSDDKLKEKGVERIKNLKNRFNPDKIIFN